MSNVGGVQPVKKPANKQSEQVNSTSSIPLTTTFGRGLNLVNKKPPKKTPTAFITMLVEPVKKLDAAADWRNCDSIYFGLVIQKPANPISLKAPPIVSQTNTGFVANLFNFTIASKQ